MATIPKAERSTADTDVAVSTTVVNAVSAATGTPVDGLPRLYDAIDPDALDVMFSGRDTEGSVRFQYAGRTVTVHADQTVDVSPRS